MRVLEVCNEGLSTYVPQLHGLCLKDPSTTVGRREPDCGAGATGRLGKSKRLRYLEQGSYYWGAFGADIEW